MPVMVDHFGLNAGSLIASSVVVATPIIIAQLDSISGNAGWAGAGLLGLVLAWLLLVHLPAQDKKMDAMIKSKDLAIEIKDKEIDKIVAEFRAEAKDQRQAHREVLDKVCAEFREQMKSERESERRSHG